MTFSWWLWGGGGEVHAVAATGEVERGVAQDGGMVGMAAVVRQSGACGRHGEAASGEARGNFCRRMLYVFGAIESREMRESIEESKPLACLGRTIMNA